MKKYEFAKKITTVIRQHGVFIIIFLLAAVLRWQYIQNDMVPFLFDHGKDSIAILHMLVTPKIKFLGPWTSIPGLYFGPAWYYLLAPFYILSGFNPASAAFAMSILVLLQMYLVYKYFNVEAATIIGFSGFWLSLSKSAWNPFPMTLLTIILLIVIVEQLKERKLNLLKVFIMAVTASFGFHFSSAFAIFYPIIVISILLFYKFKIHFLHAFIAVIGFLFPFIPQLLFEIKNNFAESRAIVAYFKVGESHEFGMKKIQLVFDTVFGQVRTTFFDSLPNTAIFLHYLFLTFLGLSLFLILKKHVADKKLKNLLIVATFFVAIPIFGLLFLHFNVWYVYPIIPVFTILFGTLVSKLPKNLSNFFIFIYVVTAVARYNYFVTVEKPIFEFDSGFYPVKKKVIDYIRSDAGTRDFSVYTFQPDVYDFPYQYEFMIQGLNGEQLPIEFAYEPNTIPYVHEKLDLLQTIDKKYGKRWMGKPKVLYYIVTEKSDSTTLPGWWGRQRFEKIIAKKEFGDRLVVYTAEPMKD